MSNPANSQTKCSTGEVVCGRKKSRFWGNLGGSGAMRYVQFNAEERSALAALRRLGLSRAQIGRQLGRHRSTVGRELQRNAAPHDGWYRATRAQERAVARRKRS